MILARRIIIGATPARLPECKLTHRVAEFSAPNTNAGDVYFGADEADVMNVSSRFALPANRRFPMHVSHLNDLHVWGTAGDLLDIIAEIEQY
jgi:hypothetical protein